MRKSVYSIMFLVFFSTVALAAEVPVYTCWQTALPVVIDGAGNEAAWQAAAPVELVDVRFLSGERKHPHRTEARMLWDHQNLYFLLIAEDPDVWSTYGQRDQALYEEEVLEIFIDPDGDEANYAEIEINPLNTVFDLLLSRPLRDKGQAFVQWNPQFRSAVQVVGSVNSPGDVDQSWAVEVALPWEALVTSILDVPGERSLPPQAGDEWRLNLYRYERVREEGEETGTIEYSAWSPVGEVNFHRPDRFGRVVFQASPTAVEGISWGEVKYRSPQLGGQNGWQAPLAR